MFWMIAAVLSAFFAGLTSVLAKCGIQKTDSDLATALRTVVVFLFSIMMVWVVGSGAMVANIPPRSTVFLALSGIATGASWICYFKALSMGEIHKVVSIDKSSTVLTVLLAMICYGEIDNMSLKLIATALLGVGVFLMVEKRESKGEGEGRAWVVYAVLAAVFAALTSILAKAGITDVESNLGTAIRTAVVLVMAWGIVLARGKHKELKRLDGKEMLFIVLSGVATGASWLFYYYAIRKGPVSVVVPIDKLSILVTVAFSYIVFKEKLSKRAFLGLALMVAGTLLMAVFP